MGDASGTANSGARITSNGDMAKMTTASGTAADVHLTGFNLCTRKGGRPDLLTNADMTLKSGWHYGLMGRNGCGKTTLLTALASRDLSGSGGGGGVPQNMAMLLVRQEIMGNNLSAVETVLRSNVKREGVKRWIEHIERELNRLDNSQGGGSRRCRRWRRWGPTGGTATIQGETEAQSSEEEDGNPSFRRW